MPQQSTQTRFSRRSFLAGVSAGLAAGAWAFAKDAAEGVVREGGLIRLTTKGRVYVAADFHGRFVDFERWMKATRLVERLKEGEDVYGVLLGDVVDWKGNRPADENGDGRIIDAILEARAKLGKTGSRLILLKGNHEHEVGKFYEMLKKSPGFNQRTRRAMVEEVYASEKGAYYRQFNFIERMTEEQFEFVRQLPVAVMMGNGVMAVHAGPAAKAQSIADIVEMKEKVVDELVWARPLAGRDEGYTAENLTEFLKRMKAEVLLCGHTPLSHMPAELVRDGIVVFGGRQVILGTSYGALAGKKMYLTIDLTRRYRDASDVQAGREIRALMEGN